MPILSTGNRKLKFSYTKKGIEKAKRMLDMEYKNYKLRKKSMGNQLRRKKVRRMKV